MIQQNITYVKSHKVSCEGADDNIGHPKVYLYLEEETQCPYCNKTFKYKNTKNESN
jgi:uncharacterized Zn-finger protein